MSRIILFTLGSVQDYIMKSRRVIDLVNSSKILSDLMESIKDKFKCEILLPCCDDIENNEYKPKFPNYLIVKYESDVSIGQELEKQVKEELKAKIKNIERLDELNNSLKEQVHKHIDSILDIYWIEAAIEDDDILTDDEQYNELYEGLYNSLEAIKYVKKFKCVPEKGRKCSICGKRNAIIYRNNTKRENPPFDIQENAKEIEDEILKEGECLCGACYIKRTFSENASVESTAQIALDNWMEVNEKNSSKEYIEFLNIRKKFINNSNQGKYQLLYKDAIINEIDNRVSEDSDNTNQLKKDKARIEELFKVFKGDQEKYYCIYRADIDDLGKWMSGEYKKSNDIGLLEYQKKLSKRINEFLTKVSNFFKNSKNTVLVYAGGDDILALMPIRKGMLLAEQIHEYFNETVKKDGLFEKITFTQGIFITHYKDTLSESLMVSKERMENIKEKYKNISRNSEKNGLIISVLTEGYSYKEFHAKNILNNQYTIAVIEELRKYFKNDSAYFHDTLGSMFLDMDKEFTDIGQKRDVIDMLVVQQKRLMKRSRKNKDKKLDTKIEELLLSLLIKNNYEYDSAGIENYFNMFYIIQKISNILGDDVKNEVIENKV